MKKYTTLILLFLFTISSFSQIKFEKGYFIHNNGTKTECLIKNHKKSSFPSVLSYKFINYEDPIVLPIESVKEFEIYGNGKYERHQVEIDVSSQNLQSLSEQRNPEWETKTLFLKVLINDKTSLFKFENPQIREKYFFKTDSSNLEQLIYKTYYTKKNQKGVNLTYLYQINKYFNCNGKIIDESSKIKYNETDLTNYFNNYNRCKQNLISKNIEYSSNKKNENKFKLNLKVLSGINFNSLEYKPDINNEFPDYSLKAAPKIGLEIEIFLPVSHEKWSFFLESVYQKYKDKTSFESATEIVDITYLQTSLGFRYYFYLNEKSALFTNLMFTFNNVLGDPVIWDDENRPSNPNGDPYLPNEGLELTYNNTYAIGFGYSYKNKLNIEFRKYASTEFSAYLDSKLIQSSIVISYNFL